MLTREELRRSTVTEMILLLSGEVLTENEHTHTARMSAMITSERKGGGDWERTKRETRQIQEQGHNSISDPC